MRQDTSRVHSLRVDASRPAGVKPVTGLLRVWNFEYGIMARPRKNGAFFIFPNKKSIIRDLLVRGFSTIVGNAKNRGLKK